MLIVVTGASRGIGLEIVKGFAAHAHCTVIAVSRRVLPAKKLTGFAGNIIALEADITTSRGRKKIMTEAARNGGGIDILVNNAATMLNKPFAGITEKELNEVFQVNFNAPFLLIQQLLGQLSKGAHVVNIGSMGGVNGTAKFRGLSVYSSSKGALGILSECLAEELKGTGISVNCLALGAVQTEMLNRAFPGYRAPLQAAQMADYIVHFALHGHRTVNGKVLPISLSTP